MLKYTNFNLVWFVGAIIYLIYCASFTNGVRHVKIRNFYCKVIDGQLGKFYECNVKPIKRDVSEINVYFKLLKPINDNLMLNLFINKRGNARNPLIYNFSIDCCKFMVNRKKYPNHLLFFQMLGFESYSNMNHTCPYMGDIFIKGYRMDEQHIRFLPVPYGEYVLSLHWFLFNKLVVQNDISFLFHDKIPTPHRNITVQKSIV